MLKTTHGECLLYLLLTKRKERVEEGGELDESGYIKQWPGKHTSENQRSCRSLRTEDLVVS